MSNYPTELTVGDRLKTETGREYVVTSADSDYVTYAYIPAKYDMRTEKKIELDTRRKSDLTWVDKVVDANNKRVWPMPKYNTGDTVLYNGKTFYVDKVYGDYGQYLNLGRSVHVDELDK